MLQVIKSDSCAISAIFFQCCFMIETQVFMTVSIFQGFFLGIISWNGASLFNGRFVSQMGASFLSVGVGGSTPWEGINFDCGFQKNCRIGVPPPSPHPLWETLYMVENRHFWLFFTYFNCYISTSHQAKKINLCPKNVENT